MQLLWGQMLCSKQQTIKIENDAIIDATTARNEEKGSYLLCQVILSHVGFRDSIFFARFVNMFALRNPSCLFILGHKHEQAARARLGGFTCVTNNNETREQSETKPCSFYVHRLHAIYRI
jgi:hypothetical protein